MTAQEIAVRLFMPADRDDDKKPVTRERVLKAQGLAMRSKIAWAAVLAAMTATQRQEVQDAGQE